ncbi:hypothetical protein JY493_00025 [Serratia marcescens]|nr:hypothetical protein [Serratia marcescens]
MDNKLSELSKPVFEIEVSGGHWLNCTSGKLTPDASADFSEWPDGVNRLYSQEYVSALLQRITELEQVPTIKHMRSVEEALICATDRVSELEAKLATPVRLPKRWDVSGQVNPPRIVEVQFEQQNRTHDQCAKAIRNAGFTVIVEGDE